jgi:hypothetical protein
MAAGTMALGMKKQKILKFFWKFLSTIFEKYNLGAEGASSKSFESFKKGAKS